MIDWRRGGLTGSLNRLVSRDVQEHMRENVIARRARYPRGQQALRLIFRGRSFSNFIVFYLCVDVAAVLLELVSARLFPFFLPSWTTSVPGGPDIKAALTTIGSGLITAQVGVLGVISIAIGLVTLIAQREGSGTDVRVYYHESLALEVVASSIALLVVLCVQLVWPLQFVLHRLGEGTTLQAFKLLLLVFHMLWLLLNLSMFAHFVATTFRFVQQSEREKLRERYTANVIFPIEMKQRLCETIYQAAGTEFSSRRPDDEPGRSHVHFGLDFGRQGIAELSRNFVQAATLYDVRMNCLLWAIRRWSKRCMKAESGKDSRGRNRSIDARPTLSFSVIPGRMVVGQIDWCHRDGGVPLSALERAVIEVSFRFKRVSNET